MKRLKCDKNKNDQTFNSYVNHFMSCIIHFRKSVTQDFSLGPLGGAMVSALCEPITGIWGQGPRRVQGQSP